MRKGQTVSLVIHNSTLSYGVDQCCQLPVERLSFWLLPVKEIYVVLLCPDCKSCSCNNVLPFHLFDNPWIVFMRHAYWHNTTRTKKQQPKHQQASNMYTDTDCQPSIALQFKNNASLEPACLFIRNPKQMVACATLVCVHAQKGGQSRTQLSNTTHKAALHRWTDVQGNAEKVAKNKFAGICLGETKESSILVPHLSAAMQSVMR